MERQRRREDGYNRYLLDVNLQVPEATQRWRAAAEERRHQLQAQQQLDVQENEPQIVDGYNSDRSRSSLGDNSSGDSSDESGNSSDDDDNHNAPAGEEAAGGERDEHQENPDEVQNEDSSENSESSEDNNETDDSGSDRDSDSNQSDSDNSDGEDEADNNAGEELQQNDQEGERIGPEERVPIYPGCPITRREGVLLIMTYALRFGLSDLAIEHLLHVVECHMPIENVYGSFYNFKKDMPERPTVDRMFYCPKLACQRPVTFDEEDNVDCECGQENISQAALSKDHKFFLSLPLKVQLQNILRDRKVFQSLRWQDNESDVINGEFYKTCIRQGTVVEGRDLTLQLNTDGVQVFLSSKIQMWPILVTINELPFNFRKNSMILCGLWFGSKPNMNTFFEPLLNELNTLHLDGFEVHDRILKVHVILSTVDSLARPPLQGLKTFRGEYGCSFCLHRGVELDNSRYYPGDIGEARTHNGHLQATRAYMLAREVAADPPAVNGVKGCSPLLVLPVFNVIQSFVPDYLHCLAIGVVKTMVVNFWTKPTPPPAPQKPYYIGNPVMVCRIDNLLLSIKPPREITRGPRELSCKEKWKGHEWRNFLLYYSLPIMKSINFPPENVNHWFLLVYSMSIFLSDHITEDKFLKAQAAVRKYVLSAEQLYDNIKVMRFNTHLLLHMPKSVKDFGGLWAWSTFSYEHYNGVLTKMFKSSQSADIQMVKNYVRQQSLKCATSGMVDDVNLPLCLRTSLGNIAAGKKSKHIFQARDNLALIGAPTRGELTVLQLNIVQNLLQRDDVINHDVQFYGRFVYKHVLYHVANYQRLIKRNNSVVRLTDNELIQISHIIKLETYGAEQFCIILGNRLHPTGDQLCSDRDLGLSADDFVTIVREVDEAVAIQPEMLDRKCVLVPFPGDDDKFCCYPLVNKHERD